jgi:hypothetical protein
MAFSKLSSTHVFWLLFFYFTLWAYTEVSEYIERDNFFHEVDDFIHAGDRFTADDGAVLQDQIDELRQQCCGED